MNDKDRAERLEQLASEAMEASRKQIVAGLRFLDSAVFALKPERGRAFQTDGNRLYFLPEDILLRAKDGLGVLSHDVLHVLFHCIFRHFSTGEGMDRRLWDLACDLAAEDLILSLHSSSFDTPKSRERELALRELRKKHGRIQAERLYRDFKRMPPVEQEYLRLTELFTVDDHALWYHDRPSAPREESDSDSPSEETEAELTLTDEMPEDADSREFRRSEVKLTEEDWERISERVKLSLESEERGNGEGGEKLLAELSRSNEKKIDYRSFLLKFAKKHEALKVDDASFDYIFYSYGMELYGDMPLIEPLEYTEEDRIKDLVLAIDTSGSTDGPLVRTFVRQSFEMLQEESVLGRSFRIHVIQCDAKVQDDVVLKTKEDVEEYLGHLELRGLGGTDFRPVFAYVDDLIRRGEIRDLRGLLYFTDGKGTFPKRKPAYDTAFIFAGDEAEDAVVPPWAMKVIFDDSPLIYDGSGRRDSFEGGYEA